MTLRTLAMVAALWLACAASALAQTGNDNDTGTGNEQPGTGQDIGTGGGGDTPVNPGGGGGTGTDQPVEDYDEGVDLNLACHSGVNNPENTYTLKKDVKRNASLEVYNNLTIDLNGHSITCNYDFCFIIYDGFTLTIVDRSPGGQKGSINCTKSGSITGISIKNGATLIADGVTITSTDGSAISNEGGTAEITGCTVSGPRGIYNLGTTTVTGGSISGTDTAIFNAGCAISINPGEYPAACSISAGNWGIYNQMSGNVTLGSGVSIANFTASGIQYSDGTVTLNAWPTFSAANSSDVSDIWLFQGNKITIGSAITAAPTKKISVRVTDIYFHDLTADALPATITSGYASYVTDGSSNVIDPAEVFTYYDSSAGFAVALDASSSSEATLVVDPNFIPVGTDVTNDLSPTASGDFNVDWEFEMPDYDVLVYFVYDNLFDPVTFAFAEGQEWMTWCSEASFTKPDGIDAYTIDDATAEAITVTQITAADANQPAVLPAYTPLLLRKNGYDGAPAEQYAVPTAPDGVYDSAKGIVNISTTNADIFGATRDVIASNATWTYGSNRTYMLMDGAFILVAQINGFAANRCWLRLKTTSNARRLEIRSGDATGVKEAKEVMESKDNIWYSLTGIRLESRPDRKGIYINGGKKVIIK